MSFLTQVFTVASVFGLSFTETYREKNSYSQCQELLRHLGSLGGYILDYTVTVIAIVLG